VRREFQRLIVRMTDYFALLDEPRRPWLDVSSLKQKFLARSSEVHPDRGVRVGAGFDVLRECDMQLGEQEDEDREQEE